MDHRSNREFSGWVFQSVVVLVGELVAEINVVTDDILAYEIFTVATSE